MKYLGFIGAGNMANAIAKGILKSKALSQIGRAHV